VNGFEVADRLAAGADPPMVVLTSSRAAEAFRDRLRGARSVRGFIAKPELSGECLSALLV
jgi:CheY-like chemotaxis protein